MRIMSQVALLNNDNDMTLMWQETLMYCTTICTMKHCENTDFFKYLQWLVTVNDNNVYIIRMTVTMEI